jgi:HK97 family phage prohead protease
MIKQSQPVGMELKAIMESGDDYVLTRYAAVVNNSHLGNDVILPGAFEKPLRDHAMPLLLINHDMQSPPIGTVVEAQEDRNVAHLPKSDTWVSSRIAPQIKNRGLRSTSIGYTPTKKLTRKDGVRELKEIRLYEISVVNPPINPLADIESVKKRGIGIDPNLEEAFELLVKSADRRRHDDAGDLLAQFADRLRSV